MKIITSNSTLGACKGVYQQLKQKNDLKNRHIIIAPDRYLASLEKRTLEELQEKSDFMASMNVEVMSFSRLAQKVLGDDIHRCLTPEGAVMLLARVIEINQDKLVYYNKSANKDGFASELCAAINSMRNSGISTEDILKNVDKLPNALKRKSQDLALIYGEYLKALEGKLTDVSTRLEALIEYLKKAEVFSAHIYCVMFQSFKAPEIEILKQLNDIALSVTVGMVSGRDNPNKRIYSDRYIKKLMNAIEDEVEIEEYLEPFNEVKNTISRYLFSYDYPETKTDCKGKIKLRCAKTMEDEVLQIALDVLDGIRNGKRYMDYEVFVSDISGYYRLIKDIFTRYNIPFFIDKKQALKDQAKVKYVISALSIVSNDFDINDVLTFVKNPIFTMDDETRKKVWRFENYCLKFNITHSRFKNEFTLGDINKDYVNESEEIRELLLNKLNPILIDGEVNIKEIVDKIKVLLIDATAENNVYIAELDELSTYYKKCNDQVDKKIKSILDEITMALDYNVDVKGFLKIFTSMVNTVEIALVPTLLDCVFFGDSGSSYKEDAIQYILGANSGKLPKVASIREVINANDEDHLKSIGLEIYPSMKESGYLDMLAIIEFMKKGLNSTSLTISYSETCSTGALIKSNIIDELIGMFSCDGKELQIEKIDFQNLSEYITKNKYDKAALLFANEDACFHNLLSRVDAADMNAKDVKFIGSAIKYLSEDEKEVIRLDHKVPEYLNEEYAGNIPDSTSVSRLEKFYFCPYAYYFKYMLRLKERQEGDFEGYEMGTILHFILEHFLIEYRDNKASIKNIKNIAYKFFDLAIKENDYEYLLERPDKARLLYRVREESIELLENIYSACEQSNFKPYILEGELGKDGVKNLYLNVGEKSVRIDGKIDRIDVLDDKFIVIDYKTFKSADLKLSQVYTGNKLQLYIYMRAVELGLNLNVAGVFYLPIFVGYLNTDDSRLKYKGQMLADKKVIKDLDINIETNKEKSIVPYKEKKGEMDLGASYCVNNIEFKDIGDYALQMATRAVELIGQGYIKPTPTKDACKYCEFNQICNYQNQMERENAKVNRDSFINASLDRGEKNE